MKRFIIIMMLISSKVSAEVPPDSLLRQQILIESLGYHYITKDSIITSSSGAVGIAQFMPSTWKWLKDSKRIPSYYDITNKNHQLHAQSVFMNYLYSVDYGIEDSLTELAFASYNAGVGRVKKLVKVHKNQWKNYLPLETKQYLKKLNL